MKERITAAELKAMTMKELAAWVEFNACAINRTMVMSWGHEELFKEYHIRPEYIGYKAGRLIVKAFHFTSRTRKADAQSFAEWLHWAIFGEYPAEEITETAEHVEETETEETEAETETAAPSAPSANEETAAEEQTTDTEEEEEEKIMFTNYTEAVTEDAAQYIRDNYTAEEIAEKLTDRDEFAEQLNDEMWIADEVTGNGSGSYTFDRAQAREYALTDIDTVREALREFCTPADTIAEKFLDEDWEYFDVTARCYVLGQAIDAALDIIEAETKAA